jgi:aryl-alcohol dehydrogenase-like predicted oxidoreductase
MHTPIEETVRAMNRTSSTRARPSTGAPANGRRREIRQAYDVARREHLIPPTMEQPQYHMFHRQRVEVEYDPLYREIGLGTTIWSPLASGLLTGKYNDGVPDGSRLSQESYQVAPRQPAQRRGTAAGSKRSASFTRDRQGTRRDHGPVRPRLVPQVNPNVSTVITGASRPEQVTENMKALDLATKLSPELTEKIESILDNKPEPEKDWRGS